MKKLLVNIINGMYCYYSRQFNVVCEHGPGTWEVTLGVEINGTIVELVPIDHSYNWRQEYDTRIEELESDILTTLEKLKAKYILNHHHRQAA